MDKVKKEYADLITKLDLKMETILNEAEFTNIRRVIKSSVDLAELAEVEKLLSRMILRLLLFHQNKEQNVKDYKDYSEEMNDGLDSIFNLKSKANVGEKMVASYFSTSTDEAGKKSKVRFSFKSEPDLEKNEEKRDSKRKSLKFFFKK